MLCDAAGQIAEVVRRRRTPLRNSAPSPLVNTGILAADAAALRGWIARLDRNNAQGEYYLTDIFAMARENRAALSVECADPVEAAGANDPWQLTELEAHFRGRARALAGARRRALG